MDKHLARFVKFAKNVMGIEAPDTSEADQKAIALQGIEATERFFSAIGMPVSIPELIGRQATDEEIREMVRKCSRDGKMNIGAMQVLTPADMEAVYRLANK